MLNPVLALMVAGAFQASADEMFRPADFSAIAIQLTESVGLAADETVAAEPAPTVCDVSYYYDDFSRYAVPVAPLIVTYDWRSPVFFDLP